LTAYLEEVFGGIKEMMMIKERTKGGSWSLAAHPPQYCCSSSSQ
jgi:hypothetical protein